jgi:hypothetical protein
MAKAEDLYILRNTLLPGLYKIGRSSDVQKRALALQASQPFRIVIVAVFPGFGFVERAIHGALKYHKVKGGAGIEWFKCPLDVIMHHIAQRLPAYFCKFVAEGGWHGIESGETAAVLPGGSPDAPGLRGSPLGRDRVSSVDEPFAGTGLATDGSGSPRKIVPDDGEFPVFGEVAGSVLTIVDVVAVQSGDDVPPGQKAGAYVFEGPEPGLDVIDYVARSFDQGVRTF